jgi:cytochrome d ubiquinol oxidase subunit I
LGLFYGHYISSVQPAKAAAMEAVWESGSNVPLYLIKFPSFSGEGNSIELIGIPGLGSFLLTGSTSGHVEGLNDIADRPPVAITFYSFRIMVILGIVFILEALVGLYLSFKDKAFESGLARKYSKIMLYSLPLPYIAIALGWAVAEVGRQPWVVYDLFRTSLAVSPIPDVQILFSMGRLTLFYLLLGGLFIYLIQKAAVTLPEVK